MKSFQTERQFSYKKLLYKCAIFLAAVVVIVYFLPREGTFNYQFDINKPWKYGLLQASFDFPIYKGDEEVRREQDSIMTNYHPYFLLSESTGEKAINQFKEDYNKNLRRIIPDPTYSHHIERILKNVYEKGIIPVEQLGNLRKDSMRSIYIIKNNTSILQSTGEIYTTKRAYEELIYSDTLHYNRNLLQRCNLNEYLTPNLIYDSEKSEAAKKDILSGISWAKGFVMNGQKIIDRGEIIDQRTFDILKSLQKEWDKRGETITEKRLTLVGQILFVSILIGCFMTYLALFRYDYYQKKRKSRVIIFPDHLLPRDIGYHGFTRFHECIYRTVYHAPDDHPYFSRLTYGIYGTYHLHSALFHLSAYTTRIYLATGHSRYGKHLQLAGTLPAFTIITERPHRCRSLFGFVLCARPDSYKRYCTA